MTYIVNARLLLEVDSEAEAADGTNELLRELQKSQVPTSCLLDYAFDVGGPVDISPDYQEGEAFKGKQVSSQDLLEWLNELLAESTNDMAGIPRDEALAVIATIAQMARDKIAEVTAG
jgi:hypothetical protein